MAMNEYMADKEELAVRTLDLFTKIWCIKSNEDDLEFECEECDFYKDDGTCILKLFKGHHRPDYRDFGSMGDL